MQGVGSQFQFVLERATSLIQAALTNQPDPTGTRITIPTLAELPDGVRTGEGQAMPGCLVSVDPGWDDMALGDDSPMGLFDPADEYNLTPKASPTAVFLHHKVNYDARLVFRLYMPSDFERRYWADALRGLVESAWDVDSNGRRVDGVILQLLRGGNIIPKKRLWEAVEFPPPEYGDDRPFGMPFQAVLRLNCDLFLSWQTSINLYPTEFVLGAYNGPPFFGPPTTQVTIRQPFPPLYGGTTTVETLPVALNEGNPFACQQVIVQCPITSPGSILIGSASEQGIELAPGSAGLTLPVSDLSQVYVRADTTGMVSWLAVS